jgi:hypothetical protein
MMKRTALAIFLLLAAFSAAAQDQAPARVYSTNKDFRNRVFEVKHRDPATIYSSVKLLGSGFEGADISMNQTLGTITVRDFPENIALIDEAIKRLDREEPAEPQVELHLYVLIGSASHAAPPLPQELTDVVTQLQSTLRYSSYGLLATSVHRTRSGRGIESSGVADSKLLGMNAPDIQPVMYSYSLRRLTVLDSPKQDAVDVENLRFSIRMPISVGDKIVYQDVGFETPVTIRQGEKVVVGTTTMKDQALIVVVTAKVER